MPSRRRRRLALAAAGVAGVVVVVLVVTAFTGLPAPGPFRRYPAARLQEMVDRIHDDAGLLRTPDDCWQTLEPDFPSGGRRPIASVDWVRSRVVVAVRADNLGRVTPRTQRAVERELQAVVDADPELTMAMVETEASPEGWSPEMACSLVVRGYVGF